MIDKTRFWYAKVTKNQKQLVELLNNYSSLQTKENIGLIKNSYLKDLSCDCFEKFGLAQKKVAIKLVKYQTEDNFEICLDEEHFDFSILFEEEKFRTNKYFEKVSKKRDIYKIFIYDEFASIKYLDVINESSILESIIKQSKFHTEKIILRYIEKFSISDLIVLFSNIENNNLSFAKIFEYISNKYSDDDIVQILSTKYFENDSGFYYLSKYKESSTYYFDNELYSDYVVKLKSKIKADFSIDYKYDSNMDNNAKREVVETLEHYYVLRLIMGGGELC